MDKQKCTKYQDLTFTFHFLSDLNSIQFFIGTEAHYVMLAIQHIHKHVH